MCWAWDREFTLSCLLPDKDWALSDHCKSSEWDLTHPHPCSRPEGAGHALEHLAFHCEGKWLTHQHLCWYFTSTPNGMRWWNLFINETRGNKWSCTMSTIAETGIQNIWWMKITMTRKLKVLTLKISIHHQDRFDKYTVQIPAFMTTNLLECVVLSSKWVCGSIFKMLLAQCKRR